MEDEQLFDKDLLIQRTGNDKELMIDLVGIFQKTYPDYFEILEKNVREKNWKGVSEIAHKMKSSVAIFGMEELRSELEYIEYTIEAKGVPDIDRRVIMLKEDIFKAINQISILIKEL